MTVNGKYERYCEEIAAHLELGGKILDLPDDLKEFIRTSLSVEDRLMLLQLVDTEQDNPTEEE